MNLLSLLPENEQLMSDKHPKVILGSFSLNSTLTNFEQSGQKELPCKSNSLSAEFQILP